VCRETCPDDKRGVFCRLTDEGFAILESAARDHVATVREFFIDIVEPEDLEAIGRAFTAISQQIMAARHGLTPVR
jgi:DNA-binding MarR family transcriptional regulator